ncbi:MAG TPA: cytochrome P450 [Thermomonospora sp.]|nr:cytochrome P450 [Thermomonospora sp.]
MTGDRTVGGERVRETSVPDTVRLGRALLVRWPGRGGERGRSRAVAWAVRLGADRHAARLLDRLRRRYGPGPLRIALPGRRAVLLLSPRDVRRVLAARPSPFTAATGGASAAHLRPLGEVPRGEAENWNARRVLDEEALDAHQKVHRNGGRYMVQVQEETGELLDLVSKEPDLSWNEYARVHGRVVRRIVLGDAARDDRMLTDLLDRLVGQGRPLRRRARAVVRDTYLRRLRMYAERAEPGTLAGALAEAPSPAGVEPMVQITQWMAGFGGAGTVAFRTLALLAVHRDRLARVRSEFQGLPRRSLPSPVSVPFLRACLLESARLWPVEPVILRRSTEETHWNGRAVPAESVFTVIPAFFDRDRKTVPFADRFTPEAWLDGRAASDGAIVPFGGGAGRCPGENLALLVGTTFLTALLRDHEPRLLRPTTLHARRPLPQRLDHTALHLRFEPAPPH